jgi:5,6-dimethylbenzimidazole synthase
MEFFDAIAKRASCRGFTDEPLTKESIDKIIAAGCTAPSALNQQPWSFTVITNKKLISDMEKHCVETRDFLAEKSGKGWVSKYDMSFIGQAKAHIIVAVDPSKIGLGSFLGEENAHVRAGSACIENMLLAATAKGLGSIWFTMYQKAHLHKTLEIPENLEIIGLLPLGVPAMELKAAPKRDHKEVSNYLD